MKSHKIIFISIIIFLSFHSLGWAAKSADPSVDSQEVKKVKAELEASYESWADERRQNYAPKWDAPLGSLSDQANQMLVEHDRLEAEERSLKEEWSELDAQLQAQLKSNQDLEDQLNGQKNLMDDKNWKVHAASKLKDLESKVQAKKAELASLKNKIVAMDEKYKLSRLKLLSRGINIDEQIQDQLDVARLEKELEAVRGEEKSATDRYQAVTNAGPVNPKVAALQQEIDGLNAKINSIESGKAAPDLSAQAAEMETLTKRKKELQTEIEGLKVSLEKIEHAQMMGVANPRIKKVVDQMTQLDQDNEALKEEIGIMQENITILRSHVKKLEYKAEAINAMKSNMGQVDQLKNSLK